jgi:hypothetical protein
MEELLAEQPAVGMALGDVVEGSVIAAEKHGPVVAACEWNQRKASIALGLLVGPILRRLRKSLTNHLPPLPEGSILGNHPRRVS